MPCPTTWFSVTLLTQLRVTRSHAPGTYARCPWLGVAPSGNTARSTRVRRQQLLESRAGGGRSRRPCRQLISTHEITSARAWGGLGQHVVPSKVEKLKRVAAIEEAEGEAALCRGPLRRLGNWAPLYLGVHGVINFFLKYTRAHKHAHQHTPPQAHTEAHKCTRNGTQMHANASLHKEARTRAHLRMSLAMK